MSAKKYSNVDKKCPVCKKTFSTKSGGNKSRTTCSRKCSNKHFSDLRTRPVTKYQTICFNHHEKKCVVCGETKIVAVHHFDHNRYNNDPSNLVPLCPTHHAYCHSRYHKLVDKKINQYVTKVKKRLGT